MDYFSKNGEALPDRFIKRGQDRIRDLDSDSEPDSRVSFCFGRVLRLRFTQCEVCQTLKAQLHSSIGLELKLGALKAYRTHLEDTFQLWQLQSLSEDGHSSSVLTIVLDGMDQSKFAVPRDPALRAAASLCPSCLDSSSCLCQTIQFAQCYYFNVVVRLRPLMHTEGQHREPAHEVAWRLGVGLDPGSSCGRRTCQKGLSLCHRDNSLGAGESHWDATCAHTL